MLNLSQKQANAEINGTLEFLTKSNSRPSICFLGSHYNVYETVALFQAKWPILFKESYKLAHLHLKSQGAYLTDIQYLIASPIFYKTAHHILQLKWPIATLIACRTMNP